MSIKTVYVSVGLILFVACAKESVDYFEGFRRPSNFPEPVYNMSGNEITKEGFELGKKLFYEPRLSRNNTISCGTCHIQSAAFTQHGHDVSHGIDDRLGRRNSPPIMNLAWMREMMWDGGVFDLDLQPIVPITAHEEMDETVENVKAKLQAHPDYPRMFKAAFGSEQITTASLMKAMSQFMLMCVSSDSKYDRVMRNEGVSFTTEEAAGLLVFRVNCATCHAEPLITNNSFRNNGIAIGLNDDMGRYEITLNEADRYLFKVPSLRNLRYSGPYMHDGRYITLDAVLDHYDTGIRETPNVDALLPVGGFKFSATDRANLKAFLQTLNDETFINNRLLSEQ